MPFTANKRAFRTAPDSVTKSYCTLVAVELALKDGNCAVGAGHDVPQMLQLAANLPSASPNVSAQLNSLASTLKTSLASLICQGKNGSAQMVPPNSYPYIRYSRYNGDWNGVQETAMTDMLNLEATCKQLSAFLITHGPALGVHL